MYTYTQFQTVS
uniref:Uncharacterized protein n=1 Tax=Arundo donax TaxID=35708 RepID=A0A0A8Y8Z0_ARUDO